MSFRSSRLALVVVVATLAGATACQKAGEAALSAATGGALDMKDGKMTITNEKGEKVVVTTDGKGDSGKLEITGPKGEKVVMTGEGKAGTVTMTGPDGQKVNLVAGDNVAVPAECPLKLTAGFSAVTAQGGTDGKGKKTCMVMAKGAGAPADVAADYERQLKGLGYEVKRSEMKMDQMESVQLAGTKGDSTLNVNVMKDPQGTSVQFAGEI
jgi:hypothetical protein